jgi:hypothetical protein
MVVDQWLELARPAGFEPATDGLEDVALLILVIAVTWAGLRICCYRVIRQWPLLSAVRRAIGHVAGTAWAARPACAHHGVRVAGRAKPEPTASSSRTRSRSAADTGRWLYTLVRVLVLVGLGKRWRRRFASSSPRFRPACGWNRRLRIESASRRSISARRIRGPPDPG